MPRRVAEVGEGHEDGNGVYGIIRDLIVEGKDARFVNKKGRFVVNWSRALDCFTDYKAKKNPQFKSKAVSRRKISNGFRSALLNYYKKEGAKEYKDAKKVNENDEVVERQFQMPPRLFKSMFRDVGPTVTEDSEEDDQEDTSSLVSSEGDDKPEVSRSRSTSDTGFDEFMDMSSHEIVEPLESSLAVAGNFLTDLGLDVIKTEGEETSVGLSDVQLPPASEMFDPSMLDSAIEEICSDGISDDISDEGIDLFGVVQDICPTSGSVKGGFQFYISLTEELPDVVKTGVAQFERVANVMVYKLNPFTLTGTVPSSQVPGEVAVTVVTDAGKKLGMTCFRYIDEMREMVRQIVKDPTLQSLWFAMWSQEHGFFGNDSNIAQVLGPIDLQGQDSSVQTKQQQSVKVLQLLVYTAAQTDAREFIEMVFSTSAGQIVFNSYKDRTPLPEDVAQANGHEELAQYLEDISTRLSKETFEDAQSCAIDWLELVKAVQKQSAEDESAKRLEQPCDIDDTSDYFADVETSSCGSSAHYNMWTNMSPMIQGPCTDEDISSDVHPVGTTMSENGPSNNRPSKALDSDEKLKNVEGSTQRPTAKPVMDKGGTPKKIQVKHEVQLDNGSDKKGVSCGSFAHVFDCISKWWKKEDSGTMAQENCFDEKEKELPSKSRSLISGLFWRVSDTGEENVQGASEPNMAKSKGCRKRPGRARSTKRMEAALNFKGIVLTFALLTVFAGFKLKETPLHLVARNGHQLIAQFLTQQGSQVNARNVPYPLPLVSPLNWHEGYIRFWEETILHLNSRYGLQIMAKFPISGQLSVQNKETPFHFTAEKEKHATELLTQYVINGTAQIEENVPGSLSRIRCHGHVRLLNDHRRVCNLISRLESLLLATKGDQKQAAILIQQGRNVTAQNSFAYTSLLLLAPKNCWPRYLCHQKCAPCQDFLTKISLCTVAFGSLSDAVRKIDKGLSQYSHEFGQTESISIYGVIKNGFAVHATFLWFSALYTVSAVTLVALLWWKCHRREHCLRRFHILPLPDNTLQPKPEILLQPVSHDNYVEKFAVIGARCEGCAHDKSTMKGLSRRSTPTFCNGVGVLFHQEHIEVARAERMERVRTWLECNQHGQEEMASLDSEVLSGPSTVVKERDELSNNKALDTAGTILIRGHSKRSLTVMKLSLHFQSRGRPVHYLRLKGLTWKTDLKQKLARKPDEAVLIIEIDELLASGLPEVTEVIQLLKELLSQNKSFTLDLCPQADSEGCLNGDLPALSDKQSTLSMKTMCLKPRKVGQLIQALSITEDLACMGEDQQVLRGHRTYIWPGHFSDENVLLNSAKTGMPRFCRRVKLFENEENEKASARPFTGTRRVDEMFSALRTIARWHVPKATIFSTRTSDCWDIVLGLEPCHTNFSMIHWLSLVGDLRTNLDENSSVRDSIAFFSCLPPRLLGEKTESEKISSENVPYLIAEVSAKLKQVFDEIIAEEGSDTQFSEMASYVTVLQRGSQVRQYGQGVSLDYINCKL